MAHPADWIGHATHPTLPSPLMKARSAPFVEAFAPVLHNATVGDSAFAKCCLYGQCIHGAVCAAADSGFSHHGCAIACAQRAEKRRGQQLRRRESQERERRRLKDKQRSFSMEAIAIANIDRR
eukprot:4243083-Karenia_brevis.AAC.1